VKRKERCDTCRFSASSVMRGQVICRRFPPCISRGELTEAVGMKNEGILDADMGIWLRTHCDDWCGEWRPPTSRDR